MTIPANSAVYQLRATLLINGKEVPIVSASIEYSLNQIPVARVQVPSGVTFNSNLYTGGNTGVLLEESDLYGRPKAQIRIEGRGTPHPKATKSNPLPAGDIDEILFDGYLLSSVVNFGTGGSSTTLVLYGWLYDLDASSFASGTFEKRTPTDWFVVEYNALVEEGAIPGVMIGPETRVAAEDYYTEDWWNDIIKPAMKFKAIQPLARINEGQNITSNTVAATNALDRITGELRLTSIASSDLNIQGEQIAVEINKYLYNYIFEGEGGNSGFDKLSSICATFGLVLAPKVHTCSLIPYAPLSDIEGIIEDNQCDFGSSGPNLGLIPRGAILYGTGTVDGIIDAGTGSVIALPLVSQFVPNLPGLDVGPFLTKAVPPYLANIVSNFSKDDNPISLDARVGIVPASAAQTSNSSTVPAIATPAGSSNFADELIKHLYFTEVFQNKTQDILCGFRTDLYPGQIIEVVPSIGSSSGSYISGLSKNWRKQGTVESVVYNLSGQGVHTNVRLRHCLDSGDLKLFEAYLGKNSSALFQKTQTTLPNGILTRI